VYSCQGRYSRLGVSKLSLASQNCAVDQPLLLTDLSRRVPPRPGELVVAQVQYELLHVPTDLLLEDGLPLLLGLFLNVLWVPSLPQLLEEPDHVTDLGLSSFGRGGLTQQLSGHKVGVSQLSLLRIPGWHSSVGLKLHCWCLRHAYRERVVS